MEIFFAAQQVSIPEMLIYAVQFMVILLFSLSFHEAAHAFIAHKCGDDTARLMGRMTLNPIVHIDPVGTLLLPGIMILTNLMGTRLPFLLGWAKPVPVNPLNFREYHKGELLVSLAGPFSNLMLLAGGAFACRMLVMFLLPVEVLKEPEPLLAALQNPFFSFVFFFAVLNSVLFIFNLIPIPPLDGSHVLQLFLSREAAESYNRVMRPYGLFILIGLLWLGAFRILFQTMFGVVEWTIFKGVGIS